MKLKKIVFFSCVSFFIFSNTHSMEMPSEESRLETEWLTALAEVRKKKAIFNNTEVGINYETAEVLNKKYPGRRTSFLKQAKLDIAMESPEFKEYYAAKQCEITLRKQLNL